MSKKDFALGRVINAADWIEDLEFQLADARRVRDENILDARAEGASLRAIADAARVSHQTIANIIAAGEQASLEAS